ncbi:nitronate monooxygenase family protein [Serpentinicella sp. ANB-PHB4]|uniref:NAD(P)H-dependent flavin oxidoreductase n=1 Tax=Serpentinicella sp. ANB-PHB4 TaxID=3074076 RepID=UPI00286246BC|nr:nitronate monooxygenase family protein [Serpentinicella sp. ANB-PHB4]MDR5658041.1 nitronate monooxygenase family protein [Serpentinicella sp. ANB-PHB4]
MNKLPLLQIGDLVADKPIIQGGMGVGISLSKLSSAVANEGGIGVISAVQTGFREENFTTNTLSTNIQSLRSEIKKARKLSPNGIIGVNIMVAINNYKETVKAAVEEKIDIIISGAGLPLDLPLLVKGSKTKIAPIVSSAKAAKVIAKSWSKKYNYLPDFVVVEGPEAGGHLGFSEDQINNNESISLPEITKEVIETLALFEEKSGQKIPVIAAGGIFSGADIAKYLKLGASGVQMGTRFVATEECDAHIDYKYAYVNAKESDVRIVKSPAGLPGRALNNPFAQRFSFEKITVKSCYNCLKTCNPATTPYCISDALIQAATGNIDEGLIFAGSKVHLIDRIMSVKELMDSLVKDAELAL